jgi:hypothetical protein
MTRSTLAAAVAAMVAVAAPAKAAPVSYSMTFINTYTTGSLPATPSGSFIYDAAAAVKFSDFKVTIRSVTFDLTAEANVWTAFSSGCAQGVSAFDILAGNTSCISNQVWAYLDGDSVSSFDLFASFTALQPNTLLMQFAGSLRSTDPNPSPLVTGRTMAGPSRSLHVINPCLCPSPRRSR